MTWTDILSLLSGAAVGFVLALVGGGGSILATPALLYLVGVANPHVAIGTSALAVSANALVNLITHARRGHVKWPCAIAFAVSGVAGASLGAVAGRQTDASVLLPLFSLLMIAVGVRMLMPTREQPNADVHLSWRNAPAIAGAGLTVGALSGFFGIGGGFLIVPGLIASSGMSMLHAVGSSLLSVGSIGAATASAYAAEGLVDWRIALMFIAGGVGGGLAGAAIGAGLAKHKNALQRVFAALIFATATYMLWRTLG
jgi:uncharacterized membrane protein YfcA